MDLYLKAANLEDAAAEYCFLQELPSENGFENPVYGMDYETFVGERLPALLDSAAGRNVKPGRVPDTWFFLWEGETICGLFKVRHCLNDALRNGSGHIGYAVHPAYRGRGYGSRGLALAIAELKAMPEFEGGEVYLSCSRTNPASLGVMLHNGGYIHHEDEEEYYVRICV